MAIFQKEGSFLYGFSDAGDGNAKLESVRQTIFETAGLSQCVFVSGQQIHETAIAVVSEKKSAVIPETDGFLTDLSGVVLGAYAADCMPVILMAQKLGVCGVVHAGWRGMAKRIVPLAVQKMKEVWSVAPREIQVILGPHIRACCFEVGGDVLKEFPAECVREKQKLDLECVVRQQMLECGVLDTKIKSDGRCTSCDKNLFSYRRDKTEERMLAYVAKI